MSAAALAATDSIINPATTMDAVTLHVGDLETMSAYYAKALALTPIEERAAGREVVRVLGRRGTPLIRLIATPGLPGVDRRQAGLFHTAFLFEDEASLAATVARAAQHPASRFVGSSDHLVSEAFYFTDPEGNGIELYRDRPRSAWTYQATGEVDMASLYLNPNAYLQKHLTEAALTDTEDHAGIIGHVHLQVGDIARARDFYVGALGFETMVGSHPGALFAAAGGYHHHVAMNTWNSAGAGPRASSLGLGDVAITVPGREDLEALTGRLGTAGLQSADDGDRVSVKDPWGTHVTVSLPGASTTESLLTR